MFEWPRFADHLHGVGCPRERVAALLADLGAPPPAPGAREVLAALFDGPALVQALERLAPRLHHVGLLAPPGLDLAAVEAVLRASRFRHQLRRFTSTVFAKDLAARLGRAVDVTVVWGSHAAHPARCPAVEVFVADLPAGELDDLVAQETGCHVALGLDPNHTLDRAREVLHAAGHWEIPVMREGPLANHEIRSSILYVDVPGRERIRRLELIASEGLREREGLTARTG